jgi:ADP-ribose pyrophosphatase YjhB (NUDIX family)
MIRNNEILLVRHTYGAAKGQLLIPGGHVQNEEMPETAVIVD